MTASRLRFWEDVLLGIPLRHVHKLLPGLAVTLLIVWVAALLADAAGKWILAAQGITARAASPISGIMMAILVGLLIRNTVGVHGVFRPGIDFCMKKLLRLGIILLGVRLSLFDALQLGAWGIPVVTLTIATGLLVTTWFTRRLQQSERLGTLIAVSTGICGLSAILSTAPVIKANDEEVAYSAASVTLFGVVAMLVYPYFAHWVFAGDALQAGLFLGTAVHETAQVAGSALIYSQAFEQPRTLEVATVTKLLRNVCLVAVVPLMAYLYLSKTPAEGRSRIAVWRLLPAFVIGFLAMAALRSIGDAGVTTTGAGAAGRAFGIWTAPEWSALWKGLNMLGTQYFLGMAMAGVGLSSHLGVFRSVGWKPLYVGLVSALSVGAAGLVMALLVGPLMR